MKKLLLGLFLSFLSTASLKAEATKTIFNPFTSKLDFITALTTNSVTASGCITITTTTQGFLINATGCSGGASGTTIRVEDQGAFTVNTSTLNFSLGLLATNDVGEGKVTLNPSSFLGPQSWSDGIADTSITVTYNVNAGTPPEWTYSDDRIETLNDLALPDLDPSRPLKTNGTQVITTGLINLADTTNEVTGILPGANLGSGSTNYIQNTDTLQAGATFFVSSGTAATFNTTTANIGTLNATTINGSPWGSANLVAYLNGANVLTTNPSFIYFDAFQILYAPAILGTTYMGGAFGAPIVSFDADNSNFVGFISSSVVTTDNLYTIPSSSGAVNQVWVLDGSNKFQNRYVDQIMKFSTWFNAEQAKLPTSNPGVISNADALRVPMLLFDASVDESVSWSGFLTPYTTTQMSAKVWYTMASATTGNVVHNLQVACASSTYSGDIDTIAFGSVSASTITVPSVAGRIGIATMTVLNTNYGCRKDDMFILKYNRDANSSQDTASGDLEVRKILIYEP